MTALMFAAEDGRLEIAELLLKNGAVVDEKNDEGETALMLAAESGHPEVAALLLERGADFTMENKEGKTALEIAKEHGETGIVKAIRDFIISQQKGGGGRIAS